MQKYSTKMTNDDWKKMNKSTIKDLKAFMNDLISNGWYIDPTLKYQGIRGRACKADYIWFITNLVK